MSTEAETTSAAATVTTPTKTAPAAGTPTGTPSKETDEARIQLVQGRRHLLVKDYFSAVAALAKGCELLAQKFGDTAPELGDAYLTYGRALLELARSESGVLEMNEDGQADGEDDEEGEEGDAEDGEDGDEEEEEEKDGKEEEKNGKAEEENGKEEEKNGKDEENETEKTNGKEAAAEEAKDGASATTNGTASTNGTDAVNGKEGEDAAAEEEEEDVNNLQLAWEVLELAKSIFQKQLESEGEAGEKQNSLKLADVHLKLGEVAVESENYTTAVEDMKACLALQRKHLDEDDRRIAETLYTMGTAFSLANEFDSAIEQYKLAVEQIKLRIAVLEKKKSEPAAPATEDKGASDDPFYTVQGEIDELKALLPDIVEKVSDMQDFKKETVRRMMDGLAEASAKQSSTADGAGPSSAPDSKPVSSVAHLVKRKPKEEAPLAVTEAKTEEAKESEEKMVTDEKAESVEKVEDKQERKRKQEEDIKLEDSSKKVKVDDDPSESKSSE